MTLRIPRTHLSLMALAAMFLLVATPLLCEFEVCCGGDADGCSDGAATCQCLCGAMAHVEEPALLNVPLAPVAWHAPLHLMIRLQGSLRLPERPPISVC